MPLLAVGVPLLFSGKSSRKSIGEFIFGFSFLFMGLSLLKANAPDLGKNPEMLSFVQNYTDMGFASVILFVLIGTVLTMVVQASAATMAITLIMCANGWISFELGAALVLGENIGTTITANLAALTGNTQSRRATVLHRNQLAGGSLRRIEVNDRNTFIHHVDRGDVTHIVCDLQAALGLIKHVTDEILGGSTLYGNSGNDRDLERRAYILVRNGNGLLAQRVLVVTADGNLFTVDIQGSLFVTADSHQDGIVKIEILALHVKRAGLFLEEDAVNRCTSYQNESDQKHQDCNQIFAILFHCDLLLF